MSPGSERPYERIYELDGGGIFRPQIIIDTSLGSVVIPDREATPEAMEDNKETPEETPEDTKEETEEERHERTRELYYSLCEDENEIENVEEYRPGGYHPIHIGDKWCDGRFEVIHKLGFGRFSTVWLARDTVKEANVAIKVRISRELKRGSTPDEMEILEHIKQLGDDLDHPAMKIISFPHEKFYITGPNGTHLCIVSDVFGPSIDETNEMKFWGKNIILEWAEMQRAAHQLTSAVSLLHSEAISIMHGGIEPRNIVLEIPEINSLSVDEIYDLVDPPSFSSRIYTAKQELNTSPSAPERLIKPARLIKLFKWRTGNIKLIGFGQSFPLGHPSRWLTTSMPTCSPEILITDKFGKPTDIWALACCIYEIRMNRSLFSGGWPDVKTLKSIVKMLGPMDRSMTGDKFAELATYSEKPMLKETLISKAQAEAAQIFEVPELRALFEPLKHAHNAAVYRKYVGSISPEKQAIDTSRSMVFEIDELDELPGLLSKALEEAKRLSKDALVAATQSRTFELETLYDLLINALRYDVKERWSAAQMLEHPWYTISVPN